MSTMLTASFAADLARFAAQRILARAEKCARGSEQRSFVRSAAYGHPTHSLAYGLKGKAKQYSGRYQASFDNLCDRLRSAGVEVIRELGPRGGKGSATYTLRLIARG